MSPPVQVKHPVRHRLYPEFHRRDSVRLQDIADLTVDIIRTRRQPYSRDSVTDILFGSLKQRYHAFTFDPREAAAEKRDFRTVSVMKRHKRCLNRFGKFPAFLSVLLRLALTVSRSLAEYIAVQAHLHCENAVVRRTVLADENIFENFLRRLLNNTLQL